MAKIKDIIGEEAYKAIPDDKKKELDKGDYEDISGGKYVEKSEYDTIVKERDQYKKDVKTRDKQISDLKEEFKDAEGLKEKVEKLEKDNKEQKEKYEGEISQIKQDNALKKALSSYNCKDEDYLLSKIDRETLKFNEDGTVLGLKEQVEPFKKDHEYLFEKTPAGTGSFGTGGTGEETGEKGKGGEEGNESIGTVLGKARASVTSGKTLNDFIAK